MRNYGEDDPLPIPFGAFIATSHCRTELRQALYANGGRLETFNAIWSIVVVVMQVLFLRSLLVQMS